MVDLDTSNMVKIIVTDYVEGGGEDVVGVHSYWNAWVDALTYSETEGLEYTHDEVLIEKNGMVLGQWIDRRRVV